MNEELRDKGWSQMEELLDREMPVKKTGLLPYYRIQAVAGAVLLLLSGLVYLGMPYFQNHETSTPFSKGEFTSAEIEKTITEKSNDSPGEDNREGFSENNNTDIRDGNISVLALNQSESGGGFISTTTSISTPNFSGNPTDLAVEMDYPKSLSEMELVPIDLEALVFEMAVDEKNTQYTSKPAVLSSPFLSPLPITVPVLSLKGTALPEDEYRGETIAIIDDERLMCPLSLAVGLSWEKPSVHKLHGLGLQIGGKKQWEKSALVASIGLTKYGWFGSSGADEYTLSSAWDNQNTESELGVVFQREYAQDLISNYWEVDMEVAWRYFVFPKFSVGPQVRLARVFDTKIKPNRDYNLDSGALLSTSHNTDGQFLVNSYYLSAGLVLGYDFNCRWGVELTYQHQLSHFWKEEESRKNGGAYTLGLGVKVGLNRSK